MTLSSFLCCLLLLLVALPSSAQTPTSVPFPLRLSDRNLHDATLKVLEDGSWEIETTGSDPYLFTAPFTQKIANLRDRSVLTFEYFSTTGTNATQVFLEPPITEAVSVSGKGLSNSEGWSRYALDLRPALDRATGNELHGLRIDLGNHAGKTVRIRGLQLRPLTAQELALAARKDAIKQAEAQRTVLLRDYLRRAYPCHVTQVAVDARQIRIDGTISGDARRRTLFLAEVPLYADVTAAMATYPSLIRLQPNAKGAFHVMDNRYGPDGNVHRDRLLSRWAIVAKTATGYELLSHARYADTVQARADLPEEKPRNKKGIGGFGAGRIDSDLTDLDISTITVNILINGLLSTEAGEGRTPYEYSGRTWYANDAAFAGLDKTMLLAAKHHIVVSAIILVAQAGNAPPGSMSRLLAHPDADPAGIFAMPNVSNKDGLDAYAAVMNYLAERYSRPDGKYGRIHHWILHNEVNAGWVWTNAGEKSSLTYMDLYTKSMRVAHLIARQYDPHAQAFISLEHHWGIAPTPQIYAGRELMDLLVAFGQAEGDFEWALAFHPYPQNLFEPRVWLDNQPTFALDTPKITYKNLEVLDAWVRQPYTFFQGRTPRVIHLTEQGLNSRDYSEASLRDQAAGMAYAWNKYKDMPSITAFDYHNWVDNRGEGGLRIGLRRFPDDKDDPMGKKPIWYVYQALGTPQEDAVLAPYKAVVGVKEWVEVRHAPIPLPASPGPPANYRSKK